MSLCEIMFGNTKKRYFQFIDFVTIESKKKLKPFISELENSIFSYNLIKKKAFATKRVLLVKITFKMEYAQ